MFLKPIREAIRYSKINKAINIATLAIKRDRMEVARDAIADAYRMQLDLTMFAGHHAYMIAAWQLLEMDLERYGHAALAERCHKMVDLLQARFDAGDYY